MLGKLLDKICEFLGLAQDTVICEQSDKYIYFIIPKNIKDIPFDLKLKLNVKYINDSREVDKYNIDFHLETLDNGYNVLRDISEIEEEISKTEKNIIEPPKELVEVQLVEKIIISNYF